MLSVGNKAIINGREYTRLAILPSLDSGLPLVLCQDASGRRAVCSEALWRDSAHQDGLAAPVHARSTTQEKISLKEFTDLFTGKKSQ